MTNKVKYLFFVDNEVAANYANELRLVIPDEQNITVYSMDWRHADNGTSGTLATPTYGQYKADFDELDLAQFSMYDIYVKTTSTHLHLVLKQYEGSIYEWKKEIVFEKVSSEVSDQTNSDGSEKDSAFLYKTETDGITITKYVGVNKNVKIPSTINNKPVTKIANRAFAYSAVTEVEMPSSVTDIGVFSFYMCRNLEKVTLSQSLKSIPLRAFGSCEKLEVVDFGENSAVTSIGDHAFNYCPELKVVDLGTISKLKTIGTGAFADCGSLYSIYFPLGLTTIGADAFSGCASLSSMIIPSTVSTIGDHAFNSSIKMYCFAKDKPDGWNKGWNGYFTSDVTWNINANRTADGLLYKNVTDQSGSHISIIGYNGVSSFVDIPEQIGGVVVSEIDPYAFYFVRRNLSVKIPESVTKVGYKAFGSCVNTKVLCEASYQPSGWDSQWNFNIAGIYWDAQTFVDQQGVVYLTTYTNAWVVGFGEIAKSVTIPSTINGQTVASIESRAFANNTTLEQIFIPSSITFVGDDVFYGVSNEGQVYCDLVGEGQGWSYYWNSRNLPVYWSTQVVEQNDMTFAVKDGNATLTSYKGYDVNVSIPSTVNGANVVAIGDRAFYQNWSIEKIYIPASVRTIGQYTFENCWYLERVELAQNNQINKLCDFAFAYCYALKQIDDMPNLVEVGSAAFHNCYSLGMIYLPDTVQKVGYAAFDNCDTITVFCKATSKPSEWNDFWDYTSDANYPIKIVWGQTPVIDANGVVYGLVDDYAVVTGYIGSSANVEIQSTINGLTVKEISALAFSENSTIKSVVIPAGVTTVGGRAFEGCYALQTVTFAQGSQLAVIEEQAFFHCNMLYQINFPEGLTTISQSAFLGCGSLTRLDLPASLQVIEDFAFETCVNVGVIMFAQNSQLTSIGQQAFSSVLNLERITLPASLTTIGTEAFCGCSRLLVVDFEQGSQLATIGEKAFAECVKLDRIWLPENIDTINQLAFYGCVQLQTAVMPGSIKYAAYNLFDGCQAVKIFVEAAEKPAGWSSFWATSTESQVYWYSATQPAASGKYWHYDSLGAPVVW